MSVQLQDNKAYSNLLVLIYTQLQILQNHRKNNLPLLRVRHTHSSFVLTLHQVVHGPDSCTSHHGGEDGKLLQVTSGNPHLCFLPKDAHIDTVVVSLLDSVELWQRGGRWTRSTPLTH